MRVAALLGGLLATLAAIPVAAEVTRFEITTREVINSGRPFGDRGPYVRLAGRVHYEIDVDHGLYPRPFGRIDVVDLKHASRNKHGRVEFWSDFEALTPEDPAKSNHTVLYDVNNRGNKLALRFFCNGGGNDLSKTEAFGDGLLLRHGFTILWSGWDGEIMPGDHRLLLNAPLARGENGPITGPVCCEVIVDKPAYRTLVVPWANHGSYRPVPDLIENATLTLRERASDERVLLPRDQWKLHVTDVDSPNPTQLPKLEIEVSGGLKPGWIYELIYTAQDPLVMGIGFMGVRDLLVAVRSGKGDNNPFLADDEPHLSQTMAFGVSQSGRFLREFLRTGFNLPSLSEDKAFDVLIPHVAGGGLGSFNHRFAQPTRHGGQHDHSDTPTDRFPFAYDDQIDPLSGQTGGILQPDLGVGCRVTSNPIILHTQSSAEYWTRAGSLPHTDPLGLHDAELYGCVRFYTFGGTQHGPAGYPPEKGISQQLANPADYRPFLRALLLKAREEELKGAAPQPSIMPRINDGTLIPWRDAVAMFPKIPGVKTPNTIHEPLWLFWGERWHTERIIDVQPPRVLGSCIRSRRVPSA